jgi:crotonobetainyl-CoA:carnitine CoA-transferase CaiB-like acyl-CoA transferase
MSGGWVAAIGILAGLYARARGGCGQRVETSLLGAGMLLHGGVFLRDGEVVRGPALGPDQTGYGPGYRLYPCSDGGWLAVVIPTPEAWAGLRALAGDLPAGYQPLGAGPAGPVLEELLATKPAAEWVGTLRALGVLAEEVGDVDRDAFRRGILDDPLNRDLGRAVTYGTDDWGRFDQIGPLLRCGPDADGGPSLHLPGVGEHTYEVLADLGVAANVVEDLLAAGLARQA